MKSMPEGRVVHMRMLNGRKRYRVFNAIAEEYITEEYSEQQMRRYMLCEIMKNVQDEIDGAISGANTSSTSVGPWQTERCRKHGVCHHDFRPGPHLAFMGVPSRCLTCGREEDTAAHRKTSASGCR